MNKAIKNTINCIVVDDEPLALALLSDYIARIPHLHLIEATSDPLVALDLAKTDSVDLIFLDMQMPELNGLQFLKILQKRCLVIVTTAYSQYALDGYEHHVVDYLLKPITLDRFIMAVEKAEERFNGMLQKHKIAAAPAPALSQHIFVKTDYRIVKINLDDIYYLEGARDYVIINTVAGQVLTLQSMKSLEELLPANLFVRVHKSYIVALNKISFIARSRVSVNGHLLPISDTFKDKLFEFVKP
ncbi:MAG: DNA-binding response regulator [Mucilaginibacter sp.]|nr:DNA-binding response regulator [Mucilaginibacter sp.]